MSKQSKQSKQRKQSKQASTNKPAEAASKHTQANISKQTQASKNEPAEASKHTQASNFLHRAPLNGREKETGDSWDGYLEDAPFFFCSAAPLLIPRAFKISAKFASGRAPRWECHDTCFRPVEIRSHLCGQCHRHMQYWHDPLGHAGVSQRSRPTIVVA